MALPSFWRRTSFTYTLHVLIWLPPTLLGLAALLPILVYCHVCGIPMPEIVRTTPSARAAVRRKYERPVPLSRHRRWYQPQYQPTQLHFDPLANRQSSFLARLPPEVRLQIYGYVLGHSLLHLYEAPTDLERIDRFSGSRVIPRKRIMHAQCSLAMALMDPDHTRNCDCSRYLPDAEFQRHPSEFGVHTFDWRDEWGYANRPTRLQDHIGIALLQTCRQIHTEAIQVLYGSNLFRICRLFTLIDLPAVIPTTHLAMIKRLQVRFLCLPIDISLTHFVHQDEICVSIPAPYDQATWEQFWSVIAYQMPGLLELDAALDVRIHAKQKDPRWWMASMLAVRHLHRCRLRLAIRTKDQITDLLLDAPSDSQFLHLLEPSEETRQLEHRLQEHMTGQAIFDMAAP